MSTPHLLVAASLALACGAPAPAGRDASARDGGASVDATASDTSAPIDALPDTAPGDAGSRFIDNGMRPSGRYAAVWEALDGGEGPLGYPLADVIGDTICAWQPFTGGTMLWLEQRSFAEGCFEFCDFPRIFAIEGFDGVATAGERYYRDPDDWDEGMDPFSCPEANRSEQTVMGFVKPLGPVRGFGKVWCERELVRAAMGAALVPELGGEGFARCASQLFQGGLVLHNPNESSYWVLLETRAWRRFPE